MNKLQVIQSPNGKDEYVLLPVLVYQALQETIDEKLAKMEKYLHDDDYVLFEPADYVDNPVALARINAGMTREELAKKLGISKGYIGKVEQSTKVSEKLLARVKAVL
jgi:DNA-binding XRE family transcriptional regulator